MNQIKIKIIKNKNKYLNNINIKPINLIVHNNNHTNIH